MVVRTPRVVGDVTGTRGAPNGMGSTRGNAESGFIRSVDDAVDRFHAGVVAQLERRVVRPGAE